MVVGSGAGGGPLAARLAIHGASVLLLEAGDDQGTNPVATTPLFYAASSEYANMSWDFFVRHYKDDNQEARNSKATYLTPTGETYIGHNPPLGSKLLGIWYPRAGTLGGCTQHNGLMTVYPHEDDWTQIQRLTGDQSWNPTNMRKYFERIENNHYLPRAGPSSIGHGFDGWLGTEVIDSALVTTDPQILALFTAVNSTVNHHPSPHITDERDVENLFSDMNADSPYREHTTGIYKVPLAANGSIRSGARDIILAVANAKNCDGSRKYKLDIRLNSFVTKIRFDTKGGLQPRAVGVDFLDGQSLYRADPRAGSATPGTPGSVNVKREVIIAGGTFNTPQILKLSGIGPKKELDAHHIPTVVNLPGVGTNLQDHYEISTVVQFKDNFELTERCTYQPLNNSDPCWAEYVNGKTLAEKGPYATDGLLLSVVQKSKIATNDRDMYTFGGPGDFRGYFEGYSTFAVQDDRHWFWATLRSQPRKNTGSVLLNSADPLDVPQIYMAYFEPGASGNDALEELEPLVEGIEFGRNIYGNLSSPYAGNFTEVYPGPNITTTSQIQQFIKDEAWGHHASGTARIGADHDPYAVLDSRLRVRGVSGLRVVDASALPQVPGYFPVISVYMISEKAADMIIEDNKQ